MSTKVPQKKNIDKGLSTIAKEISSIDGVTDLKEREIKKESNDLKTTTGQFRYNGNNFNYIMIGRSGYLFLNFRFNVEYEDEDVSNEFNNRTALLEHINERNKRNLGLKTFIDQSDEDKLLVSSNIEYVLNGDISDFKFVKNAIEILSISQSFIKIGKESE